MPQELFTRETIATLAGLSFVTLMIPNVLVQVFGKSLRKYSLRISFGIALVLSLLLALTATTTDQEPLNKDVLYWVVAIVNGFLVFSSALGSNQLISQRGGTTLGSSSFFESWL